MLKKTTIIFILSFNLLTLSAQDIKKDGEKLKTKMDLFSSKTGTLIKFIDTKLPKIKGDYGNLEARIRKINNGTSTLFFYQIVKEIQLGNSTASIEYSDLLEVLKAFKELRLELKKDIELKPDHLENKFVTTDGFELGYYVENDSSSWYMKLEKYESGSTFFTTNGDIIESALTKAKDKIDEIKNK